MTSGSRLVWLPVLFAASTLVACGGGDNGTSPSPSISIAVTPSTVTIEQGESESLTVVVTREGGYAGAVDISVQGLPSGVTASTTNIPSGAVQGSVTVDVAAGAEPGAYTLTVRGSGSDNVQASATVTLDVEETPTPAFSLELDPAQLEFDQGAASSTVVRIERSGGFEGAVQLAVSGAPDGLQTSLGGTSVSGDQTSLDVSAASDLSPDTYTLMVSGSADGLDDQSVELEVTVNESDDGGAVQAAWTFCGSIPAWFAVRDGDSGGWTRVDPSGGDTFEFEVTSDRAGVAFLEEDIFGGTELTLHLLGAEEFELMGSNFCEESGDRTVEVNVEDLETDEVASLSLGLVATSVFGAAGTSGTFEGVPEGPADLFGVRARINQSDGTQSVNRFYLERDVDPADGSTVTVDFSGTNSFDPVVETATIQNLDGDLASLFVGFTGSASPSMALGSGTFGVPTGDEARDVPFVPEDRLQEGDFHSIFVFALPDLQSAAESRGITGFYSVPQELQIPLGPRLNEPGVEVAATSPYARPRIQYERQSEYDRAWFSTFEQDGGSATVLMSSTYQGSGNVDLTFPDFSGTEGWDDGWGLQSGEEIEVSFVAIGWNGSGVLVPGTLSDELVMKFGNRFVTIEP